MRQQSTHFAFKPLALLEQGAQPILVTLDISEERKDFQGKNQTVHIVHLTLRHDEEESADWQCIGLEVSTCTYTY